MDDATLTLFSLNAGRNVGEAVAQHMGMMLSDHEERDFEDGKHKVRSLVNVRGQDVFVIQSLYSDDCNLRFQANILRT